jgi:hypothetical protein
MYSYHLNAAFFKSIVAKGEIFEALLEKGSSFIERETHSGGQRIFLSSRARGLGIDFKIICKECVRVYTERAFILTTLQMRPGTLQNSGNLLKVFFFCKLNWVSPEK